MKYSFSELVSIPEVRFLCNHFTQLTGFATAIQAMDGTVLLSTGWQEVCKQFHRANPRSAANCLKSDTILAGRSNQGAHYTLYQCKNGLIDVAVPIVIDGEQMGRFYAGQLLLEPPDMDYFQQQATEYGFEKSAYLDAVAKVPVVTEERVEQITTFLVRLAEMIGRIGLASKMLAKQEQLSTMAVDSSLAEERERRRIAAELHDNLGQLLLLCKIKFESLPHSSMPGKEEPAYLEAMDLLSRAIRYVRSMTQQLNPPLLANCGLESALEWLASALEADYALHVTYRDDGSPKPLGEELRYAVFQSARELLINVAKHAGCGEARLSISREADTLIVEVVDQGCGFSYDSRSAAGSDSSFGLFSIRQRLKHLGGELSINSAPGQGTHVTIRAPLAW